MNPNVQSNYNQASLKTANSLKNIAQEVSSLSLPEVDKAVSLIGRLIPAGNVPAVVASGLARLKGRTPPPESVQRDVNLIFKGIKQTLDKAAYQVVFGGPARVIQGYQQLLKLVGKDPADAFPDGTWQFYTQYAMREDTARHTNETHGFDTLLAKYKIQLDTVDRFTAWTMTAIYTLHYYQELLTNEWRERTYIYLLRQLTEGTDQAQYYASLYRKWEKVRPYKRKNKQAPRYTSDRKAIFDDFLHEAMQDLPDDLRQKWLEQANQAKETTLAQYLPQMSILAYLEPGAYGETRVPLNLTDTHIGLIYQGRYHLIPVCIPDSNNPPDIKTIRSQIAAIMQAKLTTPATSLIPLATAKRFELETVRSQVNQATLNSLDRLRTAPILINCDTYARELPLAEIRQQAERGLGDHALTIFHTGETFILDQSHIFFDGAWGSALAEIMTNEAFSWGAYLSTLPPVETTQTPITPLVFNLQPEQLVLSRLKPEADAEIEDVKLKPILLLRKLFKQRSDQLNLTVNDMLVLYRAIHAVKYKLDPKIEMRLEAIYRSGDDNTRYAIQATRDALQEDKQINPAILIPVDASQRSPRDRLYPLCFDVPLGELDLLGLHKRVVEALDAYKNASGDRTETFTQFNQLQREYLGTLAGFGAFFDKAKQIAIAGESTSVGAIKLLAHMPTPLQRLLDQVPGRLDFLNDLIKGREVFSNVGAVAPSSTLTRFITAKDDNEKKTLAWGVITDANGTMKVSLRDFRPHVALLTEAGHKDLAMQLTRDYLKAYAKGLNTYIRELHKIAVTSRETQLKTKN